MLLVCLSSSFIPWHVQAPSWSERRHMLYPASILQASSLIAKGWMPWKRGSSVWGFCCFLRTGQPRAARPPSLCRELWIPKPPTPQCQWKGNDPNSLLPSEHLHGCHSGTSDTTVLKLSCSFLPLNMAPGILSLREGYHHSSLIIASS
jgi:hypothetical protein